MLCTSRETELASDGQPSLGSSSRLAIELHLLQQVQLGQILKPGARDGPDIFSSLFKASVFSWRNIVYIESHPQVVMLWDGVWRLPTKCVST